ncbi:MAG: hypothetical protein AAF390_19445, partial [Pseudomonadota bacterium]
GDVGAALVTPNGHLFTGVCIDTPSWGLCAERSAMGAMVTSGWYVVAKMVAVWQNPDTGALHVLPPCGHCREFMRSIDPTNLETRIVLARDRSASLADLLPEYRWPPPLDG